VAFQIVDDVLDETSDAQTLGKSPGKDRASRKMSYPAAAGIEASRRRARELKERAVAALGGTIDSGALAAIAELVVTRSK
jgi:farnesyl diphosphate synthase